MAGMCTLHEGIGVIGAPIIAHSIEKHGRAVSKCAASVALPKVEQP